MKRFDMSEASGVASETTFVSTMRAALVRAPSSVRPRFSRFVALAAIAQAVPLVVSGSSLPTLDLACVYAVAAVGLNVILGLGGLISIGQAAVMAVGAYSAVLLFGHHSGLAVAVLAGCGAAAVVSVLMGLAGARVKTHYFVLASLAVAEVILLVATNWTGFTGGATGIAVQGTPTVAGFDLGQGIDFFRFGSVVLLGVVYLADALRASRGGLSLSALTMNEHLAISSGVSPRASLALATAVGGVLGGLGGAMLAFLDGYLGPQNYGLGTATLLLLIVIVAGRAGNGSVVTAALILTFLSQGFLTNPAVGQLAYGIGIIVLILAAPDGLHRLSVWGRAYTRKSWGRPSEGVRGTR